LKSVSIQDVLDLKRGHRSDGLILHEDCGGQIYYSLMTDSFRCMGGCRLALSWAWVHDRSIALGKTGLFQWRPPFIHGRR
jgi:hypothetical protein